MALLDSLHEAGCKEIKVANNQLVNFLEEETDFDISLSTSFEYHNVSQYKNVFRTNKRIKALDVAIDDNRNFVFLKNLKKMLPDTKIEVMLNEQCIHGCPARISHASSFYKIWNCNSVKKDLGAVEYFCKNNVIYPWNLPYYSDLGINHFKFMAFPYLRSNIKSLDFFSKYLSCVENGVENLKANDFFNGIFYTGIKFEDNVLLTDIIPLLPNIDKFVKDGEKCANICDIECTYCLNCAKKLKKAFKIQYV